MSKNPFDDTPEESYGHFYADDTQRVSSRILEDDPFSQSFVVPEGQSAKDILRYLLAVQQDSFGKTILETFTYAVLLTGAKACLKKYPNTELIYRAIKLSAQVCHYPFSFKFIKERAIPEVLQQCPHLTKTILDLPTIAGKSQTRKRSGKP